MMTSERKRLKAPPVCLLCHEFPRPHLGFYCARCEAHQERAARVVKRVLKGRKVSRLSPAEEREKLMRYPT